MRCWAQSRRSRPFNIAFIEVHVNTTELKITFKHVELVAREEVVEKIGKIDCERLKG